MMRRSCFALATLGLLAVACTRTEDRAPVSYGYGGSGSGGDPASGLATDAPRGAPIPVADYSFMTQAGFSGLAEVQTAQLAEARSASPAVRRFAAMMVTEHGRANEALAGIARELGLAAPTAPDLGRQQTAQMLAELSGSRFDREYVAIQLAEHRAAIGLFETEATGGTEPRLREFAARLLPALRQHLAQLEPLARPAVSGLDPAPEIAGARAR